MMASHDFLQWSIDIPLDKSSSLRAIRIFGEGGGQAYVLGEATSERGLCD